MNVARPSPVGTSGWGEPSYSGASLAAYRAAHGISQADVAPRFRGTVSAVAKVEQREVGEKVARRYLNAVDYLARNRSIIREQGVEAARRHGLVDDTLAERVLAAIAERSPAAVTADVAAAVGEPVDVVAEVVADLILAGRASLAVPR